MPIILICVDDTLDGEQARSRHRRQRTLRDPSSSHRCEALTPSRAPAALAVDKSFSVVGTWIGMFFIAFCLITFTRQSYMTATHWAHVSAHSCHLTAAPGPASVWPAVPSRCSHLACVPTGPEARPSQPADPLPAAQRGAHSHRQPPLSRLSQLRALAGRAADIVAGTQLRRSARTLTALCTCMLDRGPLWRWCGCTCSGR